MLNSYRMPLRGGPIRAPLMPRPHPTDDQLIAELARMAGDLRTTVGTFTW